MKRISHSLLLSLLVLGLAGNGQLFGQRFKDKLNASIPKKDNSEMYECGYVHVKSLKDKARPMALMQKAMGGAATHSGSADLGKLAVSIFYQAHLHPQAILRYPTEVPGWETCGDAVYLGMTNRAGMGMGTTDGAVTIGGKDVPHAGMGTYFQGFSPKQRGEKTVQITSSDGDKVDLTVAPATPLEILTIDGKAKDSEITIDGTKDIVLELKDGGADPNSDLHVQLICKFMGTPVIYDLLVTAAKDRIVIPKEAFKNFEGSPSPFAKANTLIVNRVNENLVEGTPVGAIRTLSCYMDWTPIAVEGDIAKGSIMTAGFDTTKNTRVNVDMRTEGEYNFEITKGAPYNSPPVKAMKKIAVASFVVRGNLEAEETSTYSGGYYSVSTTITKWFPELKKESWQALADRMYSSFAETMGQKLGVTIIPIEDVVASQSYAHAKTIQDDVTQSFVEVGAGGTKRILSTSFSDLLEDLSITFASDLVTDRLCKELGVDAVVAVTIDLDFDFESEGLNPSMNMVAFGPNLSYKTSTEYFRAKASTEALSLKDANQYGGGAVNVLYEMLKGDIFVQELAAAIQQLNTKEAGTPAYQTIWEAKL